MRENNHGNSRLVHAVVVISGFAVLACLAGEHAIDGTIRWITISENRGNVLGRIVEAERPGLRGQHLRYEFAWGRRQYGGVEQGNHYHGLNTTGATVAVTFSKTDPTTSTLDIDYLRGNAIAHVCLTLFFLAMGVLYGYGFWKINHLRSTQKAK